MQRLHNVDAYRVVTALTIVGVAIVQILALKDSWFFLDDVELIAQAREDGLTASYMTSGAARHFLPGHKVFDWLVAVPFGPSWTVAVALMTMSIALGCAYLAAALSRAFGPSWRLGIPVAFAGTAWVMISGAQWWAAGAGIYPSFCGLTGALYHHLRWRQGGSRIHAAAGVVWTAVALGFWVQAIAAPALLLALVLLASAERRWDARSLGHEALAVLPHTALVTGYVVYARAQPYFVAGDGIPSLQSIVDLTRTVVLRGLLPSLVGSGMPAGTVTPREHDLQVVAAVAVIAAFGLAVVARTRWCTSLILSALGVGVCTVTLAVGRLSEIGAAEAGTTPRYMMVGVLCIALALGALLTASGRPPRIRMPIATTFKTAATGLSLVVVCAFYLNNLHGTYVRSTFSRNSGEAVRHYVRELESQIRSLTSAQAASVVSGAVPFPVYYGPPDPSSDLRRLAPFLSVPLALSGQPQPGGGQLLKVAANGTLEPVEFKPDGGRGKCDRTSTCKARVPAGAPASADVSLPPFYAQLTFRSPAAAGASIEVRADGGTEIIPGDQTIAIPAGATAVTVPVNAAAGATDLLVTVAGTSTAPASLRLGLLEPSA